MTTVDSVNAAQPQEVTEEAATQVGMQMGMAVVAAIVNTDFVRYVGAAMEAMKQGPHYEKFIGSLVQEVEKGLQSGLPGMKARAHMARHMQAGHVAMRAQVHEMALIEGQKDIDVIDSLLETGTVIDKAVRALLEPIESNLRQLCDEGKHMQAVARIHQANQLAMADHVRDHVQDCQDPDCTIHKTH